MKNYFYFILLFVGHLSYGQIPKKIEIPIYQTSRNKTDTSSWFKDYSKLGQELKLPNLQQANETFYFRFWTHNQAIDIWTFDRVKIFGAVTNFAERYDAKLLKKGQYKIDKVFYKTKNLDSLSAKNIYKAIENLCLTDIPSDEKIKGWSAGLDGVEYLIETATKTNYSFKTYWTPSVFSDTLNEAKRIQKFVDYLFKDLNLWNFGGKLKLSKGTFKTNGIPGVQIKTTNKDNSGARTITDIL